MEKKHKKYLYFMNLPPLQPVRTSPLTLKILNPTYMLHVAEYLLSYATQMFVLFPLY